MESHGHMQWSGKAEYISDARLNTEGKAGYIFSAKVASYVILGCRQVSRATCRLWPQYAGDVTTTCGNAKSLHGHLRLDARGYWYSSRDL